MKEGILVFLARLYVLETTVDLGKADLYFSLYFESDVFGYFLKAIRMTLMVVHVIAGRGHGRVAHCGD
jgi:hypothetical protein